MANKYDDDFDEDDTAQHIKRGSVIIPESEDLLDSDKVRAERTTTKTRVFIVL